MKIIHVRQSQTHFKIKKKILFSQKTQQLLKSMFVIKMATRETINKTIRVQ